MYGLLWLIPTLPLVGFVILSLFGRRFSRFVVALVGVGLVGASTLLSILTAFQFMSSPSHQSSVTQSLWTWFSSGDFRPSVAFRLDALSLVFIVVVTFVGFIIHLYSSEFMAQGEGYSRFFATMNLFVSSMLILVLADNLFLFYLGWEGVGLCSYLLIGFWYKDAANGRAAQKAFIVTRVGDTALAVGLFLLFSHLGTLNFQALMDRAATTWPVGSKLAVIAAALFLAGAVGKSAQLPLQTWLPDAMAGPTPVSALIHAATMVTAGVYLIARTHVLFELAPGVQLALAAIGALTLLISGFSALVQVDIKRVLAYSTMSQVGYMFLALGVGAWSAAVFHFLTHAFFKALLFLGAGVVILALHEEHNMFKMGGLRKQLPLVFWTFVIGSASLSALPLVTAGFYSKEWILRSAWTGPKGNFWLLSAGLVGAFLTVIYTFRMVFITFFGKGSRLIGRKPGMRLKMPLIILAIFSIVIGFLQTPQNLGNIPIFANFLRSALPSPGVPSKGGADEFVLEVFSSAIVLLGLYLATILFLRKPRLRERITQTKLGQRGRQFLFSGWGFDWIYDRLFIRPLALLARINREDFLDLPYLGIAEMSRAFNIGLSRTQSGRLRWYAAVVVIGAIITLSVVVFL